MSRSFGEVITLLLLLISSSTILRSLLEANYSTSWPGVRQEFISMAPQFAVNYPNSISFRNFVLTVLERAIENRYPRYLNEFSMEERFTVESAWKVLQSAIQSTISSPSTTLEPSETTNAPTVPLVETTNNIMGPSQPTVPATSTNVRQATRTFLRNNDDEDLSSGSNSPPPEQISFGPGSLDLPSVSGNVVGRDLLQAGIVNQAVHLIQARQVFITPPMRNRDSREHTSDDGQCPDIVRGPGVCRSSTPPCCYFDKEEGRHEVAQKER